MDYGYNLKNIKFIKILKQPNITSYKSDGLVRFDGILCAIYDKDNNMIDFYAHPWIECPEFSKPGVYKAKVYLNKKHSNGIFDTFKYKIIEYDKEE